MTKQRLALIKERCTHLEKVKKEGLILSKSYDINQIVFSHEHNQYGRILKITKDLLAVDYNPKIIYYQRNNDWTEKQLLFLKENFRRMSNVELTEHLDKTIKEIDIRMDIENLKRRFVWTKERDEMLLKLQELSNKDIAAKLNTTVASVKGRLRRLKAKGMKIKPRRKKSIVTNEVTPEENKN